MTKSDDWPAIPEDRIDAFIDGESKQFRSAALQARIRGTRPDIERYVRRFNADAAELGASLMPLRQQSQQYLLCDAKAALSAEAARTLGCYTAADALALHFDSRIKGAGRWLYSTAFIGMCLLELYHVLPEDSRLLRSIHLGLLILFLAAWAFAFLLYFLVGWQKWQDKHQDYRALAEGLRVQFFWRLAGLSDAVENHYLQRQGNELAWIRYAIHAWQLDGPAEPPNLAFVKTCWVSGQKKYFDAKSPFNGAIDHTWHHYSKFFFLLSLGTAALLVAVLAAVELSPILQPAGSLARSPFASLERVLAFLIGTFIVAAALCTLYKERRAFAEHANNYAIMRDLFDEAQGQLDAGEDPMRILAGLGQDALAENAEWLLMHRKRPLDVPVP